MNREGREFKDIALLISSSINAIHPYLDANGRMSRVIYVLLTNSGDSIASEIQPVLSKNGRDIVNIDPGLIQTDLIDLIKKELGIVSGKILPDTLVGLWQENEDLDLKFNENVSEEQRKVFLHLLKNDEENIFFAVKKFIQNYPADDKFILKGERWSRILINNLIPDLNSTQIQEILDNYRSFKREYVTKLIDCIANPNNEDYFVVSGGNKVPLKIFFEQRINEVQERRNMETLEEKKRLEAEKAEEERVVAKEKLLKDRFSTGEGKNEAFDRFVLKESLEIRQAALEIAGKKMPESSEEQKVQILEESLFSLAKMINSEVDISKDRIKLYVQNRKKELLQFYQQFRTLFEIVDYLDNSRHFSYKICTSSDYEVPYSDQEYLDKKQDISSFLDDLFSQSVYYIDENGSTIRLKLFEIKSNNFADVVQPIFERIFFNDRLVNYSDKKVAKVSGLRPAVGKFIFEISSPQFEQEKTRMPGVAIIQDEEGVYVDIPEGSTIHSGWKIVTVASMK